MNKKISLWLQTCLLVMVAISCKNAAQPGTDPFLAKVKIDSLLEFTCSSDSTQHYAVYQPTGYTPAKKWPVVYAFDPHADGKLPLLKMREAAERFGYILVGSDNFRNGVANLNGIAAALFEDVEKRYSIDEKRVYLAGFSGGARAAATIALTNKGIRGLILSGAGIQGFSASDKSGGLVVYAMAGRNDFNMQESLAMEKELSSLGIPHFVAIFNGKHEWPPVASLNQAFLWIGFQAMQAQLVPVDKPLISWFAHASDSIASQWMTEGKPMDALEQYRLAKSSLQSLYPMKEFDRKAEAITSSETYKKALQEQASYTAMEQKLQQDYAAAFLSNDEKWWTNELAVLNEKCNTEKDPVKLGMYNRLKGFLGIAAYSFTSRAVHAGDLTDARKLVTVYRLIEPSNPDVTYYQALIYDKEGNPAKAIATLKEAIKNGLGDKGRIPGDFSTEVQKALQ